MTRVFWSTKLTGALLIFKMLCPGGGFWLVSTADFSPLLFFFFCVDRRRVLSKLLPSKAVAGFGMEISPFVFPALFSFPYTYAAVGTVPQRVEGHGGDIHKMGPVYGQLHFASLVLWQKGHLEEEELVRNRSVSARLANRIQYGQYSLGQHLL
ncbi:hypothetical protein RHMOL_Rhmol05G0023800 [Rhododendron molle]|uniref:Uncharacterized protein n=1 Tax=Rhododendron molle TaxID=49168 RepID=A0ACC0NJU1_RHOML|nr:hypothetical protein RHMOL_Rhmol05G0023800 [Rhododendron molle]